MDLDAVVRKIVEPEHVLEARHEKCGLHGLHEELGVAVVDRIGQDHTVEVFNFWVKGTVEERVLNVLERRINIFEETVGGLDPILGDDSTPIYEYDKGSWGPSEANYVLSGNSRWFDPKKSTQ